MSYHQADRDNIRILMVSVLPGKLSLSCKAVDVPRLYDIRFQNRSNSRPLVKEKLEGTALLKIDLKVPHSHKH